MKTFPFILLLALLGGLIVMGVDFLALRQYQPSDPTTSPAIQLPWGGYARRAQARDSTPLWGVDPETVSHILRTTARGYPLDARYWLDLARIEASQHGAGSALLGSHLAAAVSVQPNNPDVRWRAAQIALQARDWPLAEHHLRIWVAGTPANSQQALLIARRWIGDPGELIDRILPADEVYLSRAMTFARQQRDEPLADAVWKRLQHRLDLEHPVLLGYVDFLLDTGRHEQALAIWEAHDPHYRPGGIANGDFSRPLGASSGLNWRVNNLPVGVRLTRDETEYYYPPASLRIEFSGDHNVSMRSPWIRIPVSPGRNYRLSGQWQGKRLTTRALPYLWIQAEGGRLNERLAVPAPTFEWTHWTTTITVPEGVHMLQLRVRRDSTEAFDRYIAGKLWLDGIELQEVGRQAGHEAAAPELAGR